MDRALDILRSGEWLTRERIRMVAVLIASAAGFLYLVVTATGGIDLQGRPLGTDFSDVYAAGMLATFVLILWRAELGLALPLAFHKQSSTMASSPGGTSRGQVIAP
jgi:hypothetical protein